jgi:hypothetical protein
MTTYEVDDQEDRLCLRASWPDLPERASHEVARFQDAKLAAVARSVLGAASRYRWRRAVQLVDEGAFVGKPDGKPGSLPVLPSDVLLGDSPMRPELEKLITALIPGDGEGTEQPAVDSGGFSERVRFGNLRPLLWRDWCSHLSAEEHEALRAELDSDLEATAGPLTGRARQVAWYLSAELLIDEDHSRLATSDKPDSGGEEEKDFQRSLLQLLSSLVGLRVESTAVEWDPDNEELLRVYSPATVVGFWLDPECWYYGWPDPASPDGQPTLWQHAGTLPTDTSIGDMALHIWERTNRATWPFGGNAPGERRGRFGGRR